MPNIFVETIIHFFNEQKEQHLFETDLLFTLYVSLLWLDQFNASLINKSINFFHKKKTIVDRFQISVYDIMLHWDVVKNA